MNSINKINQDIISCRKCPRLSAYIRTVAQKKVKRFQDERYYGKPLPGFGDIHAKLLIVGLAPAAHGGNRTGRMFTGDSSGDWLAEILYKNGFSSIPTSLKPNDGLVLNKVYVTAALRCAPPQNKPTGKELENCFHFLDQEFKVLKEIKVIMCLGRIAYNASCKVIGVKPEGFGHNKLFENNNIKILTSYHPSKQNTQTGRLTWRQWSEVFLRAKKLIK